jgi:ribosome maturation factor RimP
MSWQQALERTVTGMGYDLVDVERSAGGLLRVTIDRQPGHAYPTGVSEHVLVEDCELVTRQLQFLLEVEAVDYQRLEVSSPGLDRPLRKPADWQRFTGAEVEITLRQPFQNRRRWRGVLNAGVDSSAWQLALTPDVPAKPGKPGKPALGAQAKKPNDAAARPGAAAKTQPATAALPDAMLVLDFTIDEVREACLVPVLDFKGRRQAPTPDTAAALGAEAGQEDGGQVR